MEKNTSIRELINSKGSIVNQDIINMFKSTFGGKVIMPEDEGYEKARKIWNAHIDRYPGIIARCSGVADVIAAINLAREQDLLLGVKGGGHNVGGRALCDGGMVIDLSLMKGIHVDPKNRTARVQGGATLGDVDRETHVFGMAVPTGIVSKTGIGGLTLGGGVGWLIRKYGMTCDNVLSFEMVTAEGQILEVNGEENADLFWALRGGGGNFGIVTSFNFRLHPVKIVLGGLILYPRDRAFEVLQFFRDFTQSAPDELTAYAGLLNTPDGIPVVGIIACYCGDIIKGEEILKPLREFYPPLVDAIQPIPFPQMQTLLDPSCPDGDHYYWKSTFLQRLSDEAISTLIDHANQSRSPFSSVLIEFYGGYASRVGVSETAFAQRQEQYDVLINSQWKDKMDSKENINWAKDFANAMDHFSSGSYLLNALGEETHDIIKAAFGPNYHRLVEIKKKYDPTNFFRLNQNIIPVE